MGNIEEKNQGLDIEKILEMAKFLGDMIKPSEEKKEDIEVEPGYMPLAFDEEIQTQDMKIIKSVIPFMPISQQKIIGVAVKLMEIKNILNKSEEEASVMSKSTDNDSWYKEVLVTVKPHCSSEKQNMLNVMVRLLEMKRILVQLETLKGVL